jgi:hypothetical protein
MRQLNRRKHLCGITTGITGTITIGMIGKTVPTVYIWARDTGSITRSQKCEWEIKEHIGDGVITIRTMIKTDARQ